MERWLLLQKVNKMKEVKLLSTFMMSLRKKSLIHWISSRKVFRVWHLLKVEDVWSLSEFLMRTHWHCLMSTMESLCGSFSSPTRSTMFETWLRLQYFMTQQVTMKPSRRASGISMSRFRWVSSGRLLPLPVWPILPFLRSALNSWLKYFSWCRSFYTSLPCECNDLAKPTRLRPASNTV